MITAGVIGATGYAGIELVRLLLSHPQVKKIAISSISFEGQQIVDLYPNLRNCIDSFGPGEKFFSDGILGTAEEVISVSDVIFTALPHGFAEAWADTCVKTGKKLIDLSADFRFGEDEETFKTWYKKSWDFTEVHTESVYGLPEMYREQIKQAHIVGNPGCYVTSATLGLLPALKKGLIAPNPIIVDSKSGVTGTGRNPTMTNQFSECGEVISPYGIGGHRHQPEIERNMSIAAGKSCSVIFTPHLVPMNRGIVSTLYAFFDGKPLSAEEVHAVYSDFYKEEPFVRVLPLGKTASTKTIRYSNYCDISVHTVNDGRMLETVSSLDNMLKGASGQAVQNMNLMFGFEEAAGLGMIPPAF